MKIFSCFCPALAAEAFFRYIYQTNINNGVLKTGINVLKENNKSLKIIIHCLKNKTYLYAQTK
jgi:hypothetical protein